MLKKMVVAAWLCIVGVSAYAEEPVMFPDSGPWGVVVHSPYHEGLKEIGVQWVRISVRWKEVEKSKRGEYDWEGADRLIDYYDSHGFRVMVIATAESLPDVYKDDKGDQDLVIHGLAKFCGALAERYKGKVDIWELGNEPEVFPMDGYWNNPKTYTKMARLASLQIKRADPSAHVAALSVAWMDRDFISKSLNAGLLRGKDIDIISYHGYHRQNIMPESGLAEDVAWLREAIARAAPNRDVITIDSERGYYIHDKWEPKSWGMWRNIVYTEDAQAAYLARHYLEHIWLGTEVIVWYKDMYGEESCSLYYNDESSPSGLRPMGVVYRNLSTLLPDNPKREKNDSYTVAMTDLPDQIPDPNSSVMLRSYLRNYTAEDGQQRKRLIVAAWNPVEAFDGHILESRTRTGEDYVEVWRETTADDVVEVPVEFRVSDVTKEQVVAVSQYDLLSEDCDAAMTPLEAQYDDSGLLTSVLSVGPTPTVVVIDLLP